MDDEQPVGDDLEPEDPDLDEQPAPRRPRGMYLGAAMLGLQEAMFGKAKEDTVIEIESSGDPPNLDLDGLDAPFGAEHRLVGPPLDQIKARARRKRRRR